jgi:hypothetical protein
LVQLAPSRLWETRETKGVETALPLAAIEKLGGVKGIIEEAGEAALAKLRETERERLPPLIRRLAEVSRGAALTARAALPAEAVPDAPRANSRRRARRSASADPGGRRRRGLGALSTPASSRCSAPRGSRRRSG